MLLLNGGLFFFTFLQTQTSSAESVNTQGHHRLEMHHLLHLLFTLLSSILRLDDVHRGCQTLTESLEAISPSLAQAGVGFAKRLSTAWQQFEDAYLCYRAPKRLWVRGVTPFLWLAWWSAILFTIVTAAVVIYPAAFVYIVTAAAAAYWELSWLFSVLLDNILISALCTTWCRYLTSVVSTAAKFLFATVTWSYDSLILSCGQRLSLSMLQAMINSLFSRVNASVKHMILTAIKKAMALVWYLAIYQVVLLAQVGLPACVAVLFTRHASCLVC